MRPSIRLLAYFRRRLARSVRPNRVLEAVREVVKATGVLKGKHRRALDSTVLDDAVATQDTVTQIIAAIRAVIREVPGAADVAAVQCTAHDYTDAGRRRRGGGGPGARHARPSRAALHLTGNSTAAEQLVLETFARAYMSFSELPEGVDHEAWLCNLLAAACWEYRRADVTPDGWGEAPLWTASRRQQAAACGATDRGELSSAACDRPGRCPGPGVGAAGRRGGEVGAEGGQRRVGVVAVPEK